MVLSALRIVDLHVSLRLYLSHQVHIGEFSDVDSWVPVLVEMSYSQEIVSRGLVIEDRAVVHVVLKYSEAFVHLGIYLPKQWCPFLLLLQDLHSIGAHMSKIVGLRP